MVITAHAKSSAKMRANRSTDRVEQPRQRRARDAAAGCSQGTKVAERLRVDERAETEARAGDLDVLLPLFVDDLDEDSGVRPAFVELSGRVQVPRPETEGRRNRETVP